MTRSNPLTDTFYFLYRWVRDPFLIGAVAPSGKELSANMAAAIDPATPGAVIELGPGTGSMTRAILEHGVPPGDLFPIEKDPDLYKRLAERFPDVQVTLGDACDVQAIARGLGIGPVKAVVSGLPLIGMPYDVRLRIVQGAFDVLAPGGVFVQFTYMPVSPVHPRILSTLELVGGAMRKIWLNLPPATVWVYRRLAEAQAPEPTALSA